MNYVALSSPECMSKSGHKNGRLFENVSQFKYLGTTVNKSEFD
jgi:hypothetical protein